MKTYVVYHLIHVRTPHKYIAKLFVTGVPDDKEVDWDLVDEVEDFGEFGVTHANHYIEQLTPQSESSLKRAFRHAEAEEITYEELLKMKNSI